METALLEFTFTHPQPYLVDEKLVLFSDGNLILFSPAADGGTRRSRAGVFFTRLETEELGEGIKLAEELTTIPADNQRGKFRTGVRLKVTAHSNDLHQTHSLNWNDLDPLPDFLQPAAALRDHLLDLIEKSPLAVVKLSARHGYAPGEVIFSCKNPGTHVVQFVLNPEKIEIWKEGASGRFIVWRNQDGLRMGLVGPMGVLVDGLYTPARLDAGAQASLVLKPGIPLPGTGEALAAAVQGTITLALPGEEVDSFPQTPFYLYSIF